MLWARTMLRELRVGLQDRPRNKRCGPIAQWKSIRCKQLVGPGFNPQWGLYMNDALELIAVVLIAIIGISLRWREVQQEKRMEPRPVDRNAPPTPSIWRYASQKLDWFVEAYCPYCHLRVALTWPRKKRDDNSCSQCGGMLYLWNEVTREHLRVRKA